MVLLLKMSLDLNYTKLRRLCVKYHVYRSSKKHPKNDLLREENNTTNENISPRKQPNIDCSNLTNADVLSLIEEDPEFKIIEKNQQFVECEIKTFRTDIIFNGNSNANKTQTNPPKVRESKVGY